MSESKNSHADKARELFGLGAKRYREALQEAQLIPNAVEQGSLLLEMARELPEALFDDLINATQKLSDDLYRALIFQQIAKRSSPNRQRADFARAFAAITEIKDVEKREAQINKFYKSAPPQFTEQMLEYIHKQSDIVLKTRVLVALYDQSDKTQHKTLYNELLDDINKTRNEHARMTALAYVVEHIQFAQLDFALNILRTAQESAQKAEILWVLIRRFQGVLSPDEYENLFREFLSILKTVQNSHVLYTLIRDVDRPAATPALFRDTLLLLPRIQDEHDRFDLLERFSREILKEQIPDFLLVAQSFSNRELRLAALGQIIPHAQNEQRQKILQSILQEAQQVSDTEDAVDFVLPIAAKLSKPESLPLFEFAVTAGRNLSNKDQRVRILVKLPSEFLTAEEIKEVEAYKKTNAANQFNFEGGIHFSVNAEIRQNNQAQWRLSGDQSTDAPPPPKK